MCIIVRRRADGGDYKPGDYHEADREAHAQGYQNKGQDAFEVVEGGEGVVLGFASEGVKNWRINWPPEAAVLRDESGIKVCLRLLQERRWGRGYCVGDGGGSGGRGGRALAQLRRGGHVGVPCGRAEIGDSLGGAGLTFRSSREVLEEIQDGVDEQEWGETKPMSRYSMPNNSAEARRFRLWLSKAV